MRSRFIRPLLLAIAMLFLSSASFAQIGVAITIAPPALPVYEQPVCPGDGYIWTPGYWAWGDDGYFWVPGTWVEAPQVGFLWTPGYWGWGGSSFIWYDGYWGPTVGFYGGINYGFGYFGHGFEGGRWDGGHFYYNRAVTNVNVNVIHNVYETKVDVRNDVHVSYNGHGGIDARPTREEEAAAHERHIGPVAAQTAHVNAARSNPALRDSANHGRPPIAATSRPGEFDNRGAANAAAHGNPAIHPKDLPPVERSAPPNTGNAKLDQKYQQQQNKLAAQQEKERQKLQTQQDKEHQQLTKQKATDERTQQVEQKHQQQTQQLVERHAQQRQQLQQRQAPPAAHAAPAARPK
jgi:WXXGXW repeat (2 copies)